MDKNTEQNFWTNELVMEFVNFHEEQKGIHWISEDIEKFMQSKPKKEEPQKEEQVPIKVKKEIIAFGRQRGPNGFWYEFYSQHPIPTEKYQSIKEAIEGVLNGKPKVRSDMNSPRN